MKTEAMKSDVTVEPGSTVTAVSVVFTAPVVLPRARRPQWSQPRDDRARRRVAAPTRPPRFGARWRLQPQVALIAGEPGVGKSRLVHELISAMPDAGSHADRAGRSGCSRASVRASPRRARRRRAGAAAGLQAAIADPAIGPVERLRAGLDAVRAADPAVVVVFEDLHWADSESVALFERLGDLPGRRLLVGTYRPGEVDRRNPAADLLDPPGTALPGHPPAPGAPQPRRHQRPAHRDDRPAAAVPGRGGAAEPHRRQPVLPRRAGEGGRRRRARPAQAQHGPAAVEPGRHPAPPARRARPRRRSG